jgi:ubiquinone/menaquinone biosynthesis C-methylase UbiE
METSEYVLMDKVELQLWWYQALHARLLDALAPARGNVLDVGCGTGGLLAMLASHRPDLMLTGCDIEPVAASRARSKSAARIVLCSANTLPFAAGAFNAVVGADILCHRGVEPDAAIAEMKRVLQPGGLLVLNMPAFKWLYSTHDRRVHNDLRVTAKQMSTLLLAQGFRGVRAKYWNGLLLPLMIFQRLVLARGHSAASDVSALNPLLNTIFRKVLRLERHIPLAAGGSVLAVAQRP